jgi:glycosyltransferase involved in cell wall biosynthesis
MKIALLTEKFPPDPGGLAVSVERLAGLLAGSGHTVHVFAPAHPTRQRDNLILHQINPNKHAKDTLAEWFETILRVHASQEFDLLHGYFLPQAGFLAAYAGRYLGIPSVVSARGNDLDRAIFDGQKAAHIFYALQNASMITTNATELLRKCQALAPAREAILIPNGVAADRFTPGPASPELRHSLGLGNDPVIGFSGELRAKKGLNALLLAFRELTQRHPASLLLVGGARQGSDAETLQVFEKQNPDLRICTVAQVALEKMPEYYRLMDMLVSPSLHDGLPNAVLEAMSCGLPVVGTYAGGLPDAIVDGESGLLAPPGNVKALASAMENLLTEPGLRKRLGEQARIRVQEKFTLQQELQGNLDVYQKIMRDYPNPS